MFYKKNTEKSLDIDCFRTPGSEYRGAPFWAWNSRLEIKELERQIDVFKEMGLGGFHMHVRTGLENEYLSDEFMELVRGCVDKAKKENMLAWLYDEDRWPSGAAGGIVTKDRRFGARYLSFTPEKSENAQELLACYDVVLRDDGFIESYRRIAENDSAAGVKWYAYMKLCAPRNFHNGQPYLDTLNPEAVKRFVEVTHERYKATAGDEFGKTVPAIFTDEPQFTRKSTLNNSFDLMEVRLPWTDRVPELYNEKYGCDILDTLPELLWDKADGETSVHRYRYHDFIAELFSSAFADTIGAWCEKNSIAFTGHMMEEPSLHSQCAALGEAMRSYRSFQIPGIDLLCSNYEFTTAKQCQSAVHQYGREGMLSELYGVTGWECDFRTYKQQGDWQAALGVTVRVPHLSWYAMKGEAKRDYPASIHYQSPWYKEYPVIENHFARVNTAMTRGVPVVRVAVIHPIESFWLHWGPNDKSALYRGDLNDRFMNVTKWLLEGSVDFDFISESLLPELCPNGGAPLKVGKMEYDAVIVPGCETLRSTTVERLNAFREQGGHLIFMGKAPSLCDAVLSDAGKKLCEKSAAVDFSRAALLRELEDNRVLTIRMANGHLCDKIIYQLRRDNDCLWLFAANAYEPEDEENDEGRDIRIILNGIYSAEIYDTGTGDTYSANAEYKNGKTVISRRMYGYDSLLIKLVEGERNAVQEPAENPEELETCYPYEMEYSLSEDNILLLDQAEYKLSGDDCFSEAEELLRLDNICRRRLGITERGGSIIQPWCVGDREDIDKVTLKFSFYSKIDYSGAALALENAAKSAVTLNGIPADMTSAGYYVDITIDKIVLPPIKKGMNTLLVPSP